MLKLNKDESFQETLREKKRVKISRQGNISIKQMYLVLQKQLPAEV